MAKTAKSYVVWKGRKPGIYSTWADCQAQIMGFQGALYKAYPSRREAETAFKQGYTAANPVNRNAVKAPASGSGYIKESLAVDAACSGNPGLLEFRGVYVGTGQELFKYGPFEQGTNNIGEFLGIITGLRFLKDKGQPTMPIYTDSMTAMAWVRNRKPNTKLERTPQNEELFGLMERALDWLIRTPVQNPILKWETDRWGEIPADFGRK